MGYLRSLGLFRLWMNPVGSSWWWCEQWRFNSNELLNRQLSTELNIQKGSISIQSFSSTPMQYTAIPSTAWMDIFNTNLSQLTELYYTNQCENRNPLRELKSSVKCTWSYTWTTTVVRKNCLDDAEEWESSSHHLWSQGSDVENKCLIYVYEDRSSF